MSVCVLQAKKIVEDALLSKLQGAQGRVEKTMAKLASSEAHVGQLMTERAQQEAAISALTKKLQEANRLDLLACRADTNCGSAVLSYQLRFPHP